MSSAHRVYPVPVEPGLVLEPRTGSAFVSVVLPCFNEEAAVGACVTEARKALQSLGVPHEVIVVDNGSTDASVARAVLAGARVVHEPGIGYGMACRSGLEAATGDYVVIGDADGTYDFSDIPRLITLLDEGVEFALGNRLAGEIAPGAMPWLHRRVGTPLVSGVINLLFRVEVGDVNCGLRAIKRSSYRRLDISATGMEFASEMVVQSAQQGLRIAETPVDYRVRLGGVPKLRTWSDGWRHLRLIIGSWARHSWERVSSGTGATLIPATEPEFRPGEFDADRTRL
jgi:glycosyltransferase involved in cell wall biosynthesis